MDIVQLLAYNALLPAIYLGCNAGYIALWLMAKPGRRKVTREDRLQFLLLFLAGMPLYLIAKLGQLCDHLADVSKIA